MLSSYGQGMKMLFSNSTICWLLIGTCFRVYSTITMQFFVSNYFKVYPNDNEVFAVVNSMATFVGGLGTNILSAVIIERYGEYAMTKVYLLIFKCFCDVPCSVMIFLQQDFFWLSMSGLFLQYLLAKGGSQVCIQMLQTVVDPSIKGVAVAMFMLITTIISSFSSMSLGMLSTNLGLSPQKYPKEYG